jgi:putative ABC transport system permease protein
MMIKALRLVGSRQLLERPVRTTITICGIALGVAVTIAIQAANVEVLKSFEQTVLAVAGRATLQVTGGELGMDELVIAQLRRHPAVLTASPVIQQGATVASGPHRSEPLIVMGLDLLEAADLKGLRVTGGSEPEPPFDALLAPDAIFVGRRLASDWSLKVGSKLDLFVGPARYSVTVQGIVEAQTGVPSAWESMAVMDIAAAQALLGLVGRLDRIDLVTEPTRPVGAVAEELQALLPPALTVSRPARRNEQVERMVKAFQLNLVTLSAVGLLVGLLLVYNTVAFAVVQRRREIGILRALGMGRGQICALFMGEAAVMGLIGGFAGSWFGWLLAGGLVSLLSRTVSELYVPVETLAESWLSLPTSSLLQGVLVGITVSILGAFVPGLEASRTAPARALAPGEYEVMQKLRTPLLAWTGGGGLILAALLALPGPVHGLPLFGYASAFLLLVSLSCLSPLLILLLDRLVSRGTDSAAGAARGRWGSGAISRVAAGQVTRAPGRSAVTVSALMVGIAIMVGVGIMIQSFRRTVEVWINQTVMADLVVASSSWLQGEESGMLAKRLPLSWTETLVSIPGVAAVDPYRQLRVEIQGRPASLVSRDLLLHAERSRYLFLEGGSVETLSRTVAGEGVIVSEVLARTLGLSLGGQLRLMTPAGERSFPITGVFYDYATDGGKVVMDRSLYHRLWQDDATTVFGVYVAAKQDVGLVRQRIIERLGELAGSDGRLTVLSNREIKEEILAIFDRTFQVTHALEFIAVVIALLGIVNTLLTSVLERQRELATLRAVGASARQVRRIILWESSCLGLLGAGLGLVGGGLLSILLIEVINKQSFGWTIQMIVPVGLLAEAVALALAVALVAGYLPARWAARQVVAEGLRYE